MQALGGGKGDPGISSELHVSMHLIDLFVISESMHGTHMFTSGVNFSPAQRPFSIHSSGAMGQLEGVRCEPPYRMSQITTNANCKLNLSLTSCKLSRLLEMIVREATVRQRY